jgi:predicted P-loop ATPase
MEVAGVMIAEVAELDALTKAANSAIKSFLTHRFDRFHPPYGRYIIKLPRQCVFVGSINPPIGGYLPDPTGARRFWPVLCYGIIDRDGVERDRDQLWAEAVERYKPGAPWWLETPELEALAAAEQKLRFKVDIWKDVIEAWIGKRLDIAEVLEQALGIPPEAKTRSAEIRVAAILTDLGFTKRRVGRRSDRSYRYQREEF